MREGGGYKRGGDFYVGEEQKKNWETFEPEADDDDDASGFSFFLSTFFKENGSAPARTSHTIEWGPRESERAHIQNED